MDHAQKPGRLFYTYICEKYKDVNQRIATVLDINKQKNPILVLDGLRAIACLSVLLFHYRWLSSQNFSRFPTEGPFTYVTALFLYAGNGVMLFFLLSGFLLFLPFAKALLFEDSKWPSIRRFYLRRVFRIIPAYYVSIFLLVIFFHPEFFRLTQWRVILNFLLFRMNYGYAQQINGVFWTLVVEFQFYLLLPLIAWIISLVVRRGSVRWRLTKLTLCLLAMISWGAITRYWALNIVDTTRLDWLIPRSIEVTLRDFLYGNPAYDASGRYFEVFGIGMLLCMFYVYSRNVPHTARWNRIIQHLSLIFAFLGLSSSVFLAIWNLYSLNVGAGPTLQYIFHSYESFWANTWPAFHPFLSGVSYGLCIFALLHGPAWIKRPFEVSPLRWIGAISYSLYMWHLPLAYLFLGYSFSFMHGRSIIVQYTISSLWVLIVVFPFSVLLYRYVEKPGIRLGEAILRITERRKQIQKVVAPTLNDGDLPVVTRESVVVPGHSIPSNQSNTPLKV